MILRGILDQALAGNFVCLRGYASLADLHMISEADESYQRDLIKKHRDKVISFYDKQEHLFFPEIILGGSVDEDLYGESPFPFYGDMHSDGNQKYKFNNFDLQYSTAVTKSKSDARANDRFRSTKLIIDNEKLLQGDFLKFHRIDGNHRLSVLDDVTPEEEGVVKRFRDYQIPFCLVLFRNSEDLKRHSRTLFHNLNYHQIPITKEKNLELILNDFDVFKDDALKEDFGSEYLLARKVLKSWDLEMISNIQNVLIDDDEDNVCTRTFLLNTAQRLGTECSVKKFKEYLTAINEIYNDQRMQKKGNHGLLTAFMHYAHQSDVKLKIFTLWVLNNHIYETRDIDAKELIKISDRVIEARHRTIFVSMQFSSETEANYTAIKDAVGDVNAEHKLDLKIQEIRMDQFNKGYSYKIDDEILELIEGCGYLIADLTMGNKNVYHEIGYLMGMNIGKERKQDNFIFVHNTSVSENADFSKDVGFNLKAHKVLKVSDTNTLRANLKIQIEKYYQLV